MSIENALNSLQSVLGERLRRSKPELAAHGRSESYFPLTPPDAVAYPQTTEEVSRIARICHDAGCPMIPWGAGTSLEGHGLALRGGLCIDLTRMDRLIAADVADMLAVVEPGLTREGLNDQLRATGAFFPVDPGANATLGGMAATRASGTTTVRYGTMRDNVLGLQVVLADGRVIRTGGRARKSASGYDLTGLLVGSEGTLGIITELTLRLRAQPDTIASAVCAFGSIDQTVATVIEAIQMGIPMARIEFLDAASIGAVNAAAGTAYPALPHLLLEFHGSEASVAEDSAALAAIAVDRGGRGFEWATRPEDRTRLWDMRHRAYWSILASRPGARAIVTDVCVPISALAQAVRETQADLAGAGVAAPILGHVGDGNFHAILMIDPDDPAEFRTAKALADRMAERALALGGTITGEHGIGMGKLGHMRAEHGSAWEVMGEVKRALDPRGLMNPGKVVPQN